MKKFILILLLALLTFQAIHCQEVEEQSGSIEEENGIVEEEEQANEEELVPEENVEVENEPEEQNPSNELENEVEEEIESETGTGQTEEEAQIEEEANVIEAESGEILTEDNLDNWEALNVEDFLAAEDTKNILDFGSQFVIADQQGLAQFINDTFEVIEVYSIHHQQDEDQYDLYRFNCTLKPSTSESNYLTQYIVQKSSDLLVKSRVAKYSVWTTTFWDGDNGLESGLLKTTWSYTNDTYLNQRVNSTTGELISTYTTEPWLDIVTGQFVGDDVLPKQQSEEACQAAITKALAEGTLADGDWALVGTDYWKYSSQYYFGVEYYRYTCSLKDSANNLDAYGYAYGAFPTGGEWQVYTSGIYSVEDVVVNGR